MSFRHWLPDDIATNIFNYLLPEELLENIAEIDKVSNEFIASQDFPYARLLWKEKFKLHFPWAYEKLNSITKDTDWKTLFWKTYNEDCKHIREKLTEKNNDELSKILKKMFSCAIEGHYEKFKQMLTLLLLQCENPLKLLTVKSKNNKSLLDCVRENDTYNIMLDEIYQKIVIVAPYIEQFNMRYIYDARLNLFSWAVICRQSQSAIRNAMLMEKKEEIGVRELHIAFIYGDNNTISVLISYLIKNNMHTNTERKYLSMTPLHLAAKFGHVEAATQLLLNHHA